MILVPTWQLLSSTTTHENENDNHNDHENEYKSNDVDDGILAVGCTPVGSTGCGTDE